MKRPVASFIKTVFIELSSLLLATKVLLLLDSFDKLGPLSLPDDPIQNLLTK